MKQKTGTGLVSIDQASQTISLLTTTTGFIDIYVLSVEGEPDWIIPQNLVIDTINVPAQSTSVAWEDQQIPLQSLLGNPPGVTEAVAVLLEADNETARIGVLTAAPPTAMRVRISNLRDTDDSRVLPYAYQKVLLAEQLYQVPDLDRITKSILQQKK